MFSFYQFGRLLSNTGVSTALVSNMEEANNKKWPICCLLIYLIKYISAKGYVYYSVEKKTTGIFFSSLVQPKAYIQLASYNKEIPA